MSILIIICLVSCKPEQTFFTVQSTEVSASLPTDIPIPTVTFPNPVASITSEQEALLAKLLQDQKCILPCYMGITPGKTTWNDAKIMVETLGATYLGGSKKDGIVNLGYSLLFDDNSDNGTPDLTVVQNIGFIIIDGKVQQIFSWVTADNPVSKYEEYWHRYLPAGIFLQAGKPNTIFAGVGGNLTLLYATQGIVSQYDSFRTKDLFCPQHGYGRFFHYIILTNTEYPLDIYNPIDDVAKYPNIWRPIEKIISVNSLEFYNQVVSEPETCFTITLLDK